MTEREYPRWVHGVGHDSVVAETEAEETDILAMWDAADALDQATEAARMTNALTEPVTMAPSPRKAGWPKGKPRTPRPQPTVN